MISKRGKSIFGLIIFSMFLLTIFAGVVSAAEENEKFEQGIDAGKDAVGWAGGFLEGALSPLFGDGEMLSRIFLAILLGMIIYTVVDAIFDSGKWITWFITFLITAIAIIALPANFLEAIRVQYGVMGATILTIIPLLIVLVFSVRVRDPMIARVVWLLFFMYYFALYLYYIVQNGWGDGWLTPKSIPYIGGLMVGILMLIFIAPLRSFIQKKHLEDLGNAGKNVAEKSKLLHEIQSEELEGYGATGDS